MIKFWAFAKRPEPEYLIEVRIRNAEKHHDMGASKNSPCDFVPVVLFPRWVVLPGRATGYNCLPDAHYCSSLKRKPIRRLVHHEQPGRACQWYPLSLSEGSKEKSAYLSDFSSESLTEVPRKVLVWFIYPISIWLRLASGILLPIDSLK